MFRFYNGETEIDVSKNYLLVFFQEYAFLYELLLWCLESFLHQRRCNLFGSGYFASRGSFIFDVSLPSPGSINGTETLCLFVKMKMKLVTKIQVT